MKHIRNTLFLLLTLSITASAQFNYDLTVRQETYQPLTTGTDITGGTVWDEEYYKIPIGFNFSMDGIGITQASVLGGIGCATDTENVVNVFMLTDLDLQDRGYDSNIAKSPIRYTLTGSAPNRILKYEIANAGIYDESLLYGTQDDSVNIQVWLYETSNIFEIHYGPSQLSHPSDYFLATGYPIVGYVKNLDLNSSTGGLDKFFYLQGSASAPVLDSISSLFNLSGGLNSYPSNGTVYRFGPKPVSVGNSPKKEMGISLTSNVGSDKVILNKDNDDRAHYAVLGMNGASVNISGQLDRGRNDINISNLPAGMYVLYVQTRTERKAFKIMKY